MWEASLLTQGWPHYPKDHPARMTARKRCCPGALCSTVRWSHSTVYSASATVSCLGNLEEETQAPSNFFNFPKPWSFISFLSLLNLEEGKLNLENTMPLHPFLWRLTPLSPSQLTEVSAAVLREHNPVKLTCKHLGWCSRITAATKLSQLGRGFLQVYVVVADNPTAGQTHENKTCCCAVGAQCSPKHEGEYWDNSRVFQDSVNSYGQQVYAGRQHHKS